MATRHHLQKTVRIDPLADDQRKFFPKQVKSFDQHHPGNPMGKTAEPNNKVEQGITKGITKGEVRRCSAAAAAPTHLLSLGGCIALFDHLGTEQ